MSKSICLCFQGMTNVIKPKYGMLRKDNETIGRPLKKIKAVYESVV